MTSDVLLFVGVFTHLLHIQLGKHVTVNSLVLWSSWVILTGSAEYLAAGFYPYVTPTLSSHQYHVLTISVLSFLSVSYTCLQNSECLLPELCILFCCLPTAVLGRVSKNSHDSLHPWKVPWWMHVLEITSTSHLHTPALTGQPLDTRQVTWSLPWWAVNTMHCLLFLDRKITYYLEFVLTKNNLL